MNSNSSSDVTDQRRETIENSTVTVQEHPLQDVVINSSETDFETQQNTKSGWVKFDDEAISENDNSSGGGGVGGGNSTINSGETMQTISIPRPTTPTTIQNKLSPPPPSRAKKSQQQQQPQQQLTAATNTSAIGTTTALNRNSAAVAPVQRTSITSDVAPAVLTTESTHVNLNVSSSLPKLSNYVTNSTTHSTNATAAIQTGSAPPNSATPVSPGNGIKSSITIPVESTPPMRTIELSTGRIREGFANGDVIVTLLPANTKWPWITPAIFRPELVPEELMAQGLTLTVEEYVHAMETLVNDYRFTLYNICYKRILVCWILLAFSVLLTLLFSGLQGVALFSLGVGWLFLNAAAIFFCMWVKLRLARGLERCLARVNNQLIKHKILLILDDRGRISCHKVNLCFIYFDATQCVNFLNDFLEHTEQNGGSQIRAGWEAKLDLDINDIIIQGSNPLRLSRKQERGLQLYLRYGSRWGNEAVRGLINVTPTEPGRHCAQFLCACQFIKHHLQCKPRVLDQIGMGDAAWRLTVPYQTRNTLAVKVANTPKQTQSHCCPPERTLTQ